MDYNTTANDFDNTLLSTPTTTSRMTTSTPAAATLSSAMDATDASSVVHYNRHDIKKRMDASKLRWMQAMNVDISDDDPECNEG